jgi:hypothetical protein
MRSDFALQLVNEALCNAILISAPLLGITQAVTQVLLAAAAVLAL